MCTGKNTRHKTICEYLYAYTDEPLQRAPTRKDPRDFRILDPACGSGHFLLYSFDLLLSRGYEEAWLSWRQEPPGVKRRVELLRDDYPDLARPAPYRGASVYIDGEQNLWRIVTLIHGVRK